MTDVGVRDLKANLSEYLRRASEGERIRVTDRGLPKAMLVPLSGESRIEQGIREGWIRPARWRREGLDGPKWRPPERPFGTKKGRSAADQIREDRDSEDEQRS